LKKKVSIHDIARQLNVSAATVSIVLNGKAAEKRISQELQEKILKHVNELGYRPNRIAKSLRTGKSNIIAMLVEGIADPFFSGIARIVEQQAAELDYKIFYASTENDTQITKDLIRAFRDTQVDGYIIVPPPGIEEDIQTLMDDKLPVILFDRYFPGLLTYNVVVDNFDGVYQAMLHFIKNGYRQIGFVTIVSAQTQMRDRLNGYLYAVNENGFTPYVMMMPFGQITKQEQIVQEVKLFLETHPQLEAILFATNYLAISGLESIRSLNLIIPDDMAVIGFDDNNHYTLFSPSVTAVAQPIREISEHVMEHLMECLAGKEKSPEQKTIVLPTKLIIRASSQSHLFISSNNQL
jgi:LacI family transcriptional regulator